MDCGFNLHDTMIWKKSGNMLGSNNCYIQIFEYMFVLSKGKPKSINLIRDRRNVVAGKKITGTKRTANGVLTNISAKHKKYDEFGKRFNLWEITQTKSKKQSHPATFPEQLANDHIISWSNPDDVVFDPFMGSGTTGKMAVFNNRNFIGFDICEEYCEIARKRIEEAWKEKNNG